MSDRRPIAAPRPCAECPWRLDAPPGKWPVERYAALARTIGGPGIEPLPGEPLFACHMTRQGRETACAGWLARYGEWHMGVRIAVSCGQLDVDALTPRPEWPPLYKTYGDLLDAQGPAYDQVPREHPPRRYVAGAWEIGVAP